MEVILFIFSSVFSGLLLLLYINKAFADYVDYNKKGFIIKTVEAVIRTYYFVKALIYAITHWKELDKEDSTQN